MLSSLLNANRVRPGTWLSVSKKKKMRRTVQNSAVRVPLGSWMCGVGGMDVEVEGPIPGYGPVAAKTSGSVDLSLMELTSLYPLRVRRFFLSRGRRSRNPMSSSDQRVWRCDKKLDSNDTR